jgi:uncharacterized membrane protein YdfJ with MMPL/SSD domain
MEALVIALSIDYACFILGRFIEECVIAENDVITSVENTLATAGKTVLVSGGTLAACFVGIAFFPLELIKTTGIGAVVAVVFTMGTALTLGKLVPQHALGDFLNVVLLTVLFVLLYFCICRPCSYTYFPGLLRVQNLRLWRVAWIKA